MTQVSYSRPWLLYVFVAHFGGIAAIVAAVVVAALVGSALPLLAIPAVLAVAVASTLCYWRVFMSPDGVERGRTARFVSYGGQQPQFRIYDEFLLLRQPVRGRIYTARYSYDEVLEVVYRPSTWKWLPFGETLNLVVLHDGEEMRVVAWTFEAERIASEIAEAKKRASKKDPPPSQNSAVNPARCTPSAALGSET